MRIFKSCIKLPFATICSNCFFFRIHLRIVLLSTSYLTLAFSTECSVAQSTASNFFSTVIVSGFGRRFLLDNSALINQKHKFIRLVSALKLTSMIQFYHTNLLSPSSRLLRNGFTILLFTGCLRRVFVNVTVNFIFHRYFPFT